MEFPDRIFKHIDYEQYKTSWDRLYNSTEGKIAQELDKQDSIFDGWISVENWNYYVKKYGGEERTERINVSDAMDLIKELQDKYAKTLFEKLRQAQVQEPEQRESEVTNSDDTKTPQTEGNSEIEPTNVQSKGNTENAPVKPKFGLDNIQPNETITNTDETNNNEIEDNINNNRTQLINDEKYEINVEGNIISIKNKNGGDTAQINLDVLLQYCPAQYKDEMKKAIYSMPGDVLTDIANEVTSFRFTQDEDVTTQNGGTTAVAAYYEPGTDCITIDVAGGIDKDAIIHELGHALSYTKNYNVENDTQLKNIFNDEITKFKNDGNRQFKYPGDNDYEEGDDDDNNYATANVDEMFAECYTLAVTGRCDSKDTILKYFPKSYDYIKNKVETIRAGNAGQRH